MNHNFATNHLEHFQLAARLWPALPPAKGEPWAVDPEFANQLWHWSENLTGVSFRPDAMNGEIAGENHESNHRS